MSQSLKHILLGAAGTTALVLALPAIGQDSPESLLPPGFSDPAPAPTPPDPSPAAPGPSAPSAPAAPAPPSTPPRTSAGPNANAPARDSSIVGDNVSEPSFIPDVALRPPSRSLRPDEELDLAELDDALQPRYTLSASQRRTLKTVGVLNPENGGFAPDAFGEEGGRYLTALISHLHGPILSRWGSILLRRTLLSTLNSPENVHPADFVAARAWLLLRMGEADAARMLTQSVDRGNYTPRLYEVAMQAHLAAADPAGICPYVPEGARASDAPTWDMFRPICASLSGEQNRATALLRQARRKRVTTGIDYLLAEKLIGAGFKGRRAVKIDWTDVQYFNNWRFGLGLATGVAPPGRLLDKGGRHVEGWLARAPMLPVSQRVGAADTAAALGVLSNRAMVDLYGEARDSGDAQTDVLARSSVLTQAYIADNAAERITAMTNLWDRSTDPMVRYSSAVLTARAAARIPAMEDLQDDANNLLISMFAAGLDRSADRWSNVVLPGSVAWALLAVGSADPQVAIDASALDDFEGEDDSADQLKSKLLLSALAGLGRVDAETQAEFADDIGWDISKETRWSKAIGLASQRRQQGMTALMAALGMQGKNWNAMTPMHLYHIVKCLSDVGLQAEARMIAAEAISRT